MAIFNIFSKRQKRNKGEMPDVFVYDEVPQPLRVQVVHIVRDGLGDDSGPYSSGRARSVYRLLHDGLAREYGEFTLGSSREPQRDLVEFFLQTPDSNRALDCIEVMFRAIVKFGDDQNYRIATSPAVTPSQAVEELNARFKEHGIGYAFESGEMIRIDSQFLHAETVKPALRLLAGRAYATASQEFLRAHDHFRHGRYEEAIADALKSFESVLKVIGARRNWGTENTDTAKVLVDAAFKNKLIPDYLQSEFSALRSVLESGVPTVRNKQAGHGQGTTPRQVPEYLASYILHLTASSIVFLAAADDSRS